MRFRAPRLDSRPGARRALELAFGEVMRSASDEGESVGSVRDSALASEGDADVPRGGEVVAAALRMGLAPRIAVRIDRTALDGELGVVATADLIEARRGALKRALQYEDLAGTIGRVATEMGIRLIALKGAALDLGGFTPHGARSFGDLDLLVPTDGVSALHARLVAEGFETAPGDGNEHHLPTLKAPSWGVVDLHERLRGVWRGVHDWWEVDEVVAAGVKKTSSGIFCPSAGTLAAHAIVHALDQHLLAPGHHSLTRLFADLSDLLPDGAAWGRFLDDYGDAVEPSVSRPILEALREIADLLRPATLDALQRDSRAERLLAHLVAHDLDESYRHGLRWRYRLRRVVQAVRRGELLGYIRRKLGTRSGFLE